MNATLVEHHRKFPEVEVHTVDGDHDQLMCALANNAIDIAIMTSTRTGWDDRSLPLWSERVIVAMNEGHRLAQKEIVRWSDLAGETILVPHYGPGNELEHLLRSKVDSHGSQRLLHQESALDRLLSMVSAEIGVLPMLEGATGVRVHGVTYRELHEGDEPTRLNFAAYWREANRNPTLAPFVAMLRQRYPDLSVPPATT